MTAPVDERSPFARLQSNLCDLGLDEMASMLPDYMGLVSSGQRDFCGALLDMTASEISRKQSLAFAKRVGSAGFPFVKGLADFDFGFQPSVPRATIEDLATLRFLEGGENVIFVGSPGVGKTHLAVALGVEAVRARKEVRFVECSRLVADLRDAAKLGALQKRIKYYAHASLLVIDELGYLGIRPEDADLLFQLVSARYERRSTIVTTNAGLSGWAEVFGDAVTASAIADRLCHHCTLVKITGRSYRMKDLPADGGPERQGEGDAL